MWLRTKPFSAPAERELAECLRTFAHIVDQLDLGLRDQVLDVGCGPGWLSEFLARCGYAVTGVDVSEDMVEIARGRVAAIGEEVGVGIGPVAEFHAMPVLELPWRSRFEAAILYDAMHHLDDEVATLEVIRRTLVPGGQIFIHEGVRPDPGSEGEQILIDEMKAYGTLESPFDPAYLVAVLGEAGFTDVTRFVALDELLDVSVPEEELRRVQERLQHPPMNTVVAVNPAPAELADFAARIEPGAWTQAGESLSLPVTVTNAGRCYWPDRLSSSTRHGVVTIGPYLDDQAGRIELRRSALPKGLGAGESVDAEIRVRRADVAGRAEVTVDLVREGIAWFVDYGSDPVVIPLPADG
jgi:SAM-dependent methyltransferase